MSKNAYPYPPDEFDQVDLTSRPKEVHAARRGAWSRVWPFLLVIVLVPAVAFAAVHFLADKLPGGGAAGTVSTPPPEAVEESTPPPSVEPSDQTPPAESEPPASAEPTTPMVDRTIPVVVYNQGEPGGTAAKAADALTAAGFTAASSHNAPNPATPTDSRVYYPDESAKATADEVGAALTAAGLKGASGSPLAITTVELNPQVLKSAMEQIGDGPEVAAGSIVVVL
ncbi:MAG: LytR C-terminal domain-containing protein [Bifidobacteriaceae bacterium]|nr:LytR C-terminal domain-containing protein [Bifidobacteriaceae bacterium]